MGTSIRQRGDARGRDVEVIRRVHESLLEDQARWPGLLAELTRAFNSTYAAMLTRDRSSGQVQVQASEAVSLERQRAYEAHYARLVPLSFFTRHGFAPGAVFTDAQYSDYRAYLRSELYNDFFRPLRADHLMFIALRRDEIADMSLVVRRCHSVGPYEREAAARLKRIGRHVSAAEGVLARIRAARQGTGNLNAMLDALGVAVVVADRAGRIRHMSAAAEQILRDDATLTAVGNLFGARDARLDQQLRAAIRDCADSLDGAGARPRRVVRAPPPDEGSLSPILFVSAIVWTDAAGNSLPASLVVINDPRDQHSALAAAVGGSYSLTRAECGVAGALCSGRSLAEYALAAGIAVESARTLLKRAQQKTDTHSQSELVSLLLRSGGVIRQRPLDC